VGPSHRVPRPLVPSRWHCAHGRVCQISLNALESFPKYLETCRGHSPRLRRDPIARSSGTAAPRTRRPNRPRSGGLGLIKTDLVATVRCESNCSAPLPSPAPLSLGPARQSYLRSLTPRAHLSVAPAPTRSLMGSNLVRLLVIMRSRLPDTPSCGGFA
jgi:hypothetical protein